MFVEEGECIKSSKMESGRWRDCCQSGVNPATPVYGDKPGSELDVTMMSNYKYWDVRANIFLVLSFCANKFEIYFYEFLRWY